MQKLRFVNGNGTEIDLTSGYFGITQWSGFSETELNVQSQQVPFQDGAVFLDALYNPRELSITLAINDENDLEKRYELKRELIAVMNAKLGEGYLYYKNDFIEKRIKVIPQLPIFENKNSNDAGTLKASLSWTAPEVYWEDVEETSVSLYGGYRKEINYAGDYLSGVKCDIITSSVKNPVLKNLTENKKIELSENVVNNFQINTNFGKKNINNQSIKYNPSTQPGFYELAFGEGKLVGIGNQCVLISYDAEKWEEHKVSISFSSICFNKAHKLFYSVDSNRGIYKSSDGINWTLDHNGVFSKVYSNGETTVAIGQNKIAYCSTPGSWTDVNLSYNLNSITYDSENEIWVGVGAQGTILTSSNLTTWTLRTSGTNENLTDVVYSPKIKRTVVVSDGQESGNTTILYSDDCITWNNSNIPASPWYSLKSIYWSERKNEYLSFTVWDKKMLSSSDGIAWNISDSPIGDQFSGPADYIFCKSIGVEVLVGLQAEAISYDNENWIILYKPNIISSYSNFSFSKKHNMIVAKGKSGGLIMSSDGGKTWVKINDELTNPCWSEQDDCFYAQSFREVNNVYVIDIYKSTSISSSGIDFEFLFTVSNNFEDSPSCLQMLYDEFYDVLIFNVEDDEGSYIYFGKNSSMNRQFVSPHELFSITTNNQGKIIFGFNDGKVVTTSNLEDFTVSTIEDAGDVFYGTYSDELKTFVLSAQNGIYICSGDFIFKQVTLPDNIYIDGIIWVSEYNCFVCVNSDGQIIISTDLNYWEVKKEVVNSFSYIIFNSNNNSFILNGNILAYIDFEISDSLISKITEDSNMSLSLIPGKNVILLNCEDGSLNAILTYRQKYLGV